MLFPASPRRSSWLSVAARALLSSSADHSASEQVAASPIGGCRLHAAAGADLLVVPVAAGCERAAGEGERGREDSSQEMFAFVVIYHGVLAVSRSLVFK